MQHKFKGQWITAEEFCDLKSVNVFHRQLEKAEINAVAPKNSHILFRKNFTIDKCEDTFIYISADDYYKLYINGQFVCQGPAAAYPFHYYYNKVDISKYLKKGENTVAIHTYYQGLINRVWVSGDDRAGLILDIIAKDKVLLSSDESFKYSYHKGFEQIGKYGYETQFAEKYISQTESEGFFLEDYDDSDWKNARLKKYVDYKLFLQPTKMLEFEEIAPKEIKRDESGITVDFGANYVGYLNAEAIGKPNEKVELLFGQELNADGSVRWQLRANCDYKAEWILSGKRDKLSEFDYKAYRYVKICADKDTKIENISLSARHYPFELKAKPNTNDPMLLKIWELCVNSLKYGVQEVIQDCMEREKGNYLGDGCYTALAFAILTNDTSQIKKLVDDSMRSSFINKGLMTCACCSFMQEIAEFPLYMFYLLYSYYRLTGDKEYLREKYDGLCEILDFYKENYMQENGLLSNLDKWCVVEWPAPYRDGYDAEITEGKICTDVHNAINAHYIGAVKYLNKISSLLGKEPYCDEEPLVRAYQNAFYNKNRKLFKDNIKSAHISLPSNAYALMYGLYPDNETAESIIKFVEEKGFSNVMLFASFGILEGLKKLGKTEIIHKFLKDEGAWLRMLKEGATTTFEGWGKEAKSNASLFHLTLSYAVVFLTDWEKFE